MAVDMFLKLDGIKGESVDDKHKDEIEVLSFSWGVNNLSIGSATGGAGAGKASFQDFHFTKKTDKASPQLMLHCATGEHIKDALITVRNGGDSKSTGLEFMTIKLTDLLVSSLADKSDAGDEGPEESLTLNFAQIQFSFMPEQGDTQTVGWDLKTNKGGIIAISPPNTTP